MSGAPGLIIAVYLSMFTDNIEEGSVGEVSGTH